jgi:hypothetical protein
LFRASLSWHPRLPAKSAGASSLLRDQPLLAHNCSICYTPTVNFNVYLDDDSAKRLDRIAESTRKPRNALIREAVQVWLREQGRRWPREVLEFPGDPSLDPFEMHRAELLAPADDPFQTDAPRRAVGKRRRRDR